MSDLDPVTFFTQGHGAPHLVQKIFGDLDVSEVRNGLAVSKGWNKTIKEVLLVDDKQVEFMWRFGTLRQVATLFEKINCTFELGDWVFTSGERISRESRLGVTFDVAEKIIRQYSSDLVRKVNEWKVTGELSQGQFFVMNARPDPLKNASQFVFLWMCDKTVTVYDPQRNEVIQTLHGEVFHEENHFYLLRTIGQRRRIVICVDEILANGSLQEILRKDIPDCEEQEKVQSFIYKHYVVVNDKSSPRIHCFNLTDRSSWVKSLETMVNYVDEDNGYLDIGSKLFHFQDGSLAYSEDVEVVGSTENVDFLTDGRIKDRRTKEIVRTFSPHLVEANFVELTGQLVLVDYKVGETQNIGVLDLTNEANDRVLIALTRFSARHLIVHKDKLGVTLRMHREERQFGSVEKEKVVITYRFQDLDELANQLVQDGQVKEMLFQRL